MINREKNLRSVGKPRWWIVVLELPFGTMLAMINLYGIDHKLVKSFNNSLEAYRRSFNRIHNYYSGKSPKQERNDYIYRIFRKSNLIR